MPDFFEQSAFLDNMIDGLHANALHLVDIFEGVNVLVVLLAYNSDLWQ